MRKGQREGRRREDEEEDEGWKQGEENTRKGGKERGEREKYAEFLVTEHERDRREVNLSGKVGNFLRLSLLVSVMLLS